jgi:hypothetical protein
VGRRCAGVLPLLHRTRSRAIRGGKGGA